jgi:CheY-like chemotaxis protein
LERRNSDWLQGRNSSAQGEPVLIADDSDIDIFFLLRAFAEAKVQNPIYVVRNGKDAFSYLEGSGSYSDRALFPNPRIVLLDLRMPAPDGFALLKWKQQQPEMNSVLFVAMSNFGSAQSVRQAYAAGATTFLNKPLNPMDIRNLIEAFDRHWLLEV